MLKKITHALSAMPKALLDVAVLTLVLTVLALIVNVLQLQQGLSSVQEQATASLLQQQAQGTSIALQQQAQATLVDILGKQLQVQSELATLQASGLGVGPTGTAIAQQQAQLNGTVQALTTKTSIDATAIEIGANATSTAIAQRIVQLKSTDEALRNAQAQAAATATALVPILTATPTLGIGSTKISLIDSAQMMFVPAGEFFMGSNDYDDEKPPHTVYLDSFWIDKFEVTNALYKKCVDARKCQPPRQSAFSGQSLYFGDPTYDGYPVVDISWYDAGAFCSWAGKRLATEAEWEKAARGTDGRKYPWGNIWDGTRLNFCDKNCPYAFKNNDFDDKFTKTAPVGSFPSGASPYGVMDTAGNVWEWVADWYSTDFYKNSPPRNPKNDTPGSNRVVRGGSWDNDANKVRTTSRHQVAPSDVGDTYGFRCVE